MLNMNSTASANTVGPLVSVCIPTYKGAAFIAETINSVLNQSYKNIEIIVVNDKSPDETSNVMEGFSDCRLTYIVNSSNLGPEANWNKCQQLATGTYFKLLPHDDVLSSNCIANQVAVFEADRNKEISIVFGMREIIGPNGKRFMTRGISGGKHGRINSNQLISTCIRAGTNIIGEPGNGLIRRELVHSVGAYDATFPYVVDLDYWFRILRRGDGFYIKNITSSFRLTAGSWSAAIGVKQYADFKFFVQRYSVDSNYSISRIDKLIGLSRAAFNTIARIVIYKFLF
jgi:glycosyltransferase involved in cell wall biosynthesis